MSDKALNAIFRDIVSSAKSFVEAPLRLTDAGTLAVGDMPLVTVAPLTLFVDDMNGNDANDGLSVATALKTLPAAVAKVPKFVAHTVDIQASPHLGTGYAVPEFMGHTFIGGRIYVRGMNPTFTDYGTNDLVAAEAAVAGSSQFLVNSTSVLVPNALDGKTIEILTGAAAGDLRTISTNSATGITPTSLFSAAVAPGDTFRVFESTVVIDYPGTTPDGDWHLAVNCGTPAQNTLPTYKAGGIYLTNLACTTGTATSRVFILGSRVVFAGFEVRGTNAFLMNVANSGVMTGIDNNDSTFGLGTQGPVADGFAASDTKWKGWCFSSTSTSLSAGWAVGQNSASDGYLYARSVSINSGGIMRLRGGRLTASATISAITVASSYSRLEVVAENASLPILATNVANTVGVARCSSPGSTLQMQNVTIGNSGGPGIVAEDGGTVFLLSGVTGTASTFAYLARRHPGSCISISGAPGVTSTTAGNDISVDGVAGDGVANSFLAAAGDSVSSPEGLVVRT